MKLINELKDYIKDIPVKERLEIIDSFNIDKKSYVLQGICMVDDYILLSAYDGDKLNNSKIFIIENNKVIHETLLDTNAHLGGICYDDYHKFLWITDKLGTISAYNINDILNNNSVKPVYEKIDVGDKLINIYNNNAVAYITYFDNFLYVGNYNVSNKSYIKKLPLDNLGKIDLSNSKLIKSDSMIQGICFKKVNEKTYLFVSSSYGKFIKSRLKVYLFNNDILDLYKEEKKTYLFSPMMEQIIIKDNILYVVYESNAEIYKSVFNNNKDIIFYDISNILK